MLLRFCDCCKSYTLKTVCPKEECKGAVTRSAHPARFTPQDEYQKYRIALKRKFNLLPSQQAPEEL